VSYRCIVADPPWRFGDKLGKRGAAANYETMSVEELCAMPLLHDPKWVDPNSAVLFMWRVASMQREALDVLHAWGFRLHSELVWNKQTRTGKPHFGMGRIVRAAHETCLIGVRKRYSVRNHSTRSTFAAAVGAHSAKPDAFYDLVQQLVPGPRLELFARTQRPGWTCLGLEVQRI
jgi:N6-adenosine-specific RNA methylase IME4